MHLRQSLFSKRLRQKKHRISTPRGHFPGLLFRKQNYKFTYPLKILRGKLLRSGNHGAQIMSFFTVIFQSSTTLRYSAFVSKTWTVQQSCQETSSLDIMTTWPPSEEEWLSIIKLFHDAGE